MRRKYDWRGFVSIMLLVDFAVLLVSGVVLYVAPSGRVARDIGFTFLSLDRDAWDAVHTVFGYMMVVLLPFHLYFNWRIFLNYFYKMAQKAKKVRVVEALVVAAVTVFLMISAVQNFPPSSWIMELGERLSFQIEQSAAKGPSGEGGGVSVSIKGYMTLKEAADVLGISIDEAIRNLKAAGIDATEDMTVRDIMDKTGLGARDVGDLMKGGGD